MKERSKNSSTLLFMLLTGVLVVIAFISYNKIRQFNKSVDWVLHGHVVKDNIVELRSNIKDAEIGQRGYLITNDSAFLQPFITAEQHSKLIFATLDSLIADNAGQQENLKKLKTLFDERYLMLNNKLKLFKNNPSTNLLTDSLMLISKNKMDEVRKQIALMLQTEDTFLQQRILDKDSSATITPIFLLLLSLFSIVALTFFFSRLQKEISLRVSTEKLVEVETEARKKIVAGLKEISDYKYALDESSIVAITDQKGIIKYVNDNFCTISKYTRQELIGQDHRIISSGYHPKAFIRNIWTTIANGKLWKGELKNKAKDGTIYWVDTTIVPFLDDLGKPYQYVAIRADITAQKKSEEAIVKIATHLTLATDSANVGTWSLNIKTQKLEWGAVHKRMWGYNEDREDLTYEDWHKLIVPEDKELAFENIEEARVNNTIYNVEYRIRCADDETIHYMRSFGKFYYNDKCEAETITGISIDITEQKDADEKIKESETKFRTLAETLPHLVWMTDEKGKYEYTSGSWMEYSGLDPHIEETWQQLVHPDDMKAMMDTWEKSLSSGQTYVSEVRLKNTEGEYKWHVVNGEAIKNKKGEIVKWIGAFTDTHDQKLVEEQIRLLNASLEEKVKSRTEELHEKNLQLELANTQLASFSYVASHDLKEPLRKIQTFSRRILETETFSDKTLDYFNRIISAGERMQNLIDSLLDFSSVSSTELIFKPCDLNTIVEEAKNDLHISIIEKQATIEHENLPVIMGVSIQISQLIANLLSNAIKYSRPGIKPLIKISSSVIDGDRIEHTSANKQTKYHAITIADNGIGFEQEYANKIFELFQRLHGKNEYSGTGIGLGIVKKIVTNHNGLITAEGKPNIGSTFTIYLPKA